MTRAISPVTGSEGGSGTGMLRGVAEPLLRRFRRHAGWRQYRRQVRDGYGFAMRRWWLERKILATPPVTTVDADHASAAACEVHVLTWDGDWRGALWAAKTLYRFAKIDWPLVWHAGGSLSETHRQHLLSHFPQSRVIGFEEADAAVEPILRDRGLHRCLHARRGSVMMRKLLDLLVLGRSRNVLTMDSDVLFFAPPTELLARADGRVAAPLFIQDVVNSYNIDADRAATVHGVKLLERVNAGLVLTEVDVIPLQLIEDALADEQVARTDYFIEQTLWALLASRIGGEILPATYALRVADIPTSVPPRELVCAHYPGFPRPLMYDEGLRRLIDEGFLRGGSGASGGRDE